MIQSTLIQEFTSQATQAKSIVQEIGSFSEAVKYVVSLCHKKWPSPQPQFSHQDQVKTIAAPGLYNDELALLKKKCQENNILVIKREFRNHASGLNLALTHADFGISQSGTLILDSSSEDLRVATMLAEIHVAILSLKKIYPSLLELTEQIEKIIDDPPNYLAFISGASRTADIERVLTLGVHGPLELHILLLDSQQQGKNKTDGK